jgi:hypothetical protein
MTKEKEDLFIAGMTNSNYVHMDDTGMKHKGVNHHLHVICNILFSVFFIELKKDSITIQKILGLLNDETLGKILLSDDARQYLGIAIWHSLCWVHEIRLHKKLNPVIEYHRFLLDNFISKLWDYLIVIPRSSAATGTNHMENCNLSRPHGCSVKQSMYPSTSFYFCWDHFPDL